MLSIQSVIAFTQYTIISAVALVLDYMVYWSLVLSNQLSVGLSAAIGYMCGLVFAYLLMSARLFKNGWLANQKVKEVALFALSGLIGISLSYAITEIYVRNIDSNIHVAKILATLICFVTVFTFRKLVVFRQTQSREPT